MALSDDFDPEDLSPVVPPTKPRLLKILGPGLITGASDDDPSGIATYSQAGAQFGYALSWTMLFSYPLMSAAQMISARIGRTTGHGLAGILRLHYPNWLLQAVVVLLLVANTINLGADLGAMAAALNLLLPGPRPLYIILFAGICIYMQVFLQYTRYVAVLKWLTLALFAYFAALIATEVDWGKLASHLVIPQVHWSTDYLTAIVAVLGTTISPYLFFWQSAEEVEDIHAYPRRVNLLDAPEQGKRALHRIEIDTMVGMALSNLVALAIIITSAANLNFYGITDIATSAQAAEALRPVAGPFAFWVFTIGIVGTGLLAVPVLAGSAAYAIGEARRWPIGFSRRWQEAKAFYGTIALATIVGMIINFTAINPIKALYWSAVLNGVIAVPVMVTMMLMSVRRDIMGPFAVRGRLLALGWASTIIMGVAVVGMLATAI
ncbi:NRAMP family divalent metal transporter [Microvirga terricola]|uniref:Divalent metal cation transporter n=1 Tax=Microvirga terricola TaxID=2719797 RepID=A0ABX0VEK9_9HYPH|nr:divalent metal cation transporter [Microvirga terricola]NIX78265.1 divalent metal cation transporter [Microvirga terricola]